MKYVKRLRFRDKPDRRCRIQDAEARLGDPHEAEEELEAELANSENWEYLGSFHRDDYHVQDDDDDDRVFHLWRRHKADGHGRVMDNLRSQEQHPQSMPQRLAEMNRRNAEFYKEHL